ncbi:MAG: hypothetical protein GKR89_32155 [Candidatus Latescibacteria bacterium]|nr:hypothetical protein [Candidatus Latescibacterota bacterium]
MSTNLKGHSATPAAQPAEALRRQYERDGFLLLSGLIDQEVSHTAAQFLLQQPGMQDDQTALRPPDLYHEGRGLVEHYARRDASLLACCSDAFVDMTGLLVDQATMHRPDGIQTQNIVQSPRPWTNPGPHIDGIPKENKHRTFPGPYRIAFIFYLSNVEPEGGGTIGWPGSHKKVRQKAQSNPEAYQYLFDLNKEIPGLDLGEPVELLPRRGDILFFQHLWAHGATLNTHSQPRLALRPLCSCSACAKRWYKRDGWSFWQP